MKREPEFRPTVEKLQQQAAAIGDEQLKDRAKLEALTQLFLAQMQRNKTAQGDPVM